GLLALRLVRHLELAIRDAGFLLEALGAGVGGLVEGLVELPAHVEHDREREQERPRDLHGGMIAHRLSSGVVSTAPRVYLAGPLGFSQAGRHFYQAVFVPVVASLGYAGRDPWAHTDQRRIDAIERMPPGGERVAAWRALNREIGAAN